jgi:hypothetical protein
METKAPSQEKVDEYLNFLRETGAVNMFGAAPYVADAFKIDLKTARSMLTHWMENFKG